MSAITPIPPETLNKWLDNNEVVLIDVREHEEYLSAHIPGAIHIPLNQCHPDTIPHDPNKKLVFQCRKGKRGHMACEACIPSWPNTPIYNLEGGIEAWIQAGLATESKKP